MIHGMWAIGSCLVLGLAGCGLFAEGEAPASDKFASCRGKASDDQVVETIQIADEYGDSLHEMVACGQLNVALCNGVIEGIIDAILAQSNDAMPSGWNYQGDGVYHTSGANVTMDTRFYLTEAFSFGGADDLVVENLFAVDSYLTDAVALVDYNTGGVSISYTAHGPLVELLGLGTTPPNPISVTLSSIDKLGVKLGALAFDADIVVNDPREHSVIRYQLRTPRMPARALIDGSPMTYQLSQADGVRGDLGQTVEVNDWTVAFVDEGGGALDGSIKFHVEGRHFPFAGVMTFMRDVYPQSELRCQ